MNRCDRGHSKIPKLIDRMLKPRVKFLSTALAKRFKSSTTYTKPLYITTPIFYPNAAPHLGHLYSMLLCDVRHRWEVLKGKPSFFTTGTDEHGLKIQTAAEIKGVQPLQLVDDLAIVFKDLAKKANIEYDRFIRTTDADHVKAVQHFWKVLVEKGLIYKGEHSGWYSVSDETFYPETQIEEREGKWYSVETGTEVAYTSESNYFFSLSQFQQQLITHYESNPSAIIPKQKHTELLNELKSAPLQDLSVSRPASRLYWGIEVPGDSTQIVYVWIDALVNYLTSTGYPASVYEKRWPATHLIGKDIARFHCIYWPALLFAAEVALPEQVVVHGHWLSEGFKMSKSRGNVVEPLNVMSHYGTDAVRLFLCENSVLTGDGNFSEVELSRSRDQIVDKFANLAMRACGKKFNLVRAIENSEADESHKFEDDALQHEYELLFININSLRDRMDAKLVEFKTAGAVQHWWNLVIQANQFVQLSEPWKRGSLEQDKIIYIAAEAARVSAILIKAIAPELSETVLTRLNVKNDTWETAQIGGDRTYGEGANRAGDYPIKKVPCRVE